MPTNQSQQASELVAQHTSKSAYMLAYAVFPAYDQSMASTSSSTLDLPITATHGGSTQPIPASVDTIAALLQTLYDLFSVPPATQKIIHRGKQLQLLPPSTPISSVLPPGAKLMLIGAKEVELQSSQRAAEERQKKKAAFDYHKKNPGPKPRNTRVGGVEDGEYGFERVVPFPPEVPSEDARKKMLDRLLNDEAIKDIMKRHQFSVGTLTELHPLLQPELLGLNKNGGEEISLRLLTDDLAGTRPYLEVRRVLIHELTHNEISPHDDQFKTLNSQLTREVSAFEEKLGLRAGQAPEEPWEPDDGADDVERTWHTLNEVDSSGSSGKKNSRKAWKFGEEEELEERRERMRRAAEGRMRRATRD